MLVKFLEKPVVNKAKSIEAGYDKFDKKLYAQVIKQGGQRMEFPVDDAKLRTMLTGTRDPQITELYKRAYASFKELDKVAYKGTPLEQWSLISREDAETVKRLGIGTVEDLANAEGAFLERTKKFGEELKKKACDFLSSREEDSGTVAEIGTLRSKVADLEATVAVKEEIIAEKDAVIAKLMAEKEAAQAQNNNVVHAFAGLQSEVQTTEEVLSDVVTEATFLDAGAPVGVNDYTGDVLDSAIAPAGLEGADGATIEETTGDEVNEPINDLSRSS